MLLTLILLQVRSQTYQGFSKLIPSYYQFEFKLKNMILRPNTYFIRLGIVQQQKKYYDFGFL
jgi:hypothetical protein